MLICELPSPAAAPKSYYSWIHFQEDAVHLSSKILRATDLLDPDHRYPLHSPNTLYSSIGQSRPTRKGSENRATAGIRLTSYGEFMVVSERALDRIEARTLTRPIPEDVRSLFLQWQDLGFPE